MSAQSSIPTGWKHGYPQVVWIDSRYARWTFDSEDRNEQQWQFEEWCGWFGYSEDDEPERVDGKRWWIRSSLK